MSAQYPVLPVAGGALLRAFASLVALVTSWLKELARARRHRREANILAGLDRRMLADIGITRADVRDAFSEPFWDDPTALLRERALERRLECRRSARSSRCRRKSRLPASAYSIVPRARRTEITQTAEPSHRPLDPTSAIIPSRGRIRARRPLRRALYLNLIYCAKSLC